MFRMLLLLFAVYVALDRCTAQAPCTCPTVGGNQYKKAICKHPVAIRATLTNKKNLGWDGKPAWVEYTLRPVDVFRNATNRPLPEKIASLCVKRSMSPDEKPCGCGAPLDTGAEFLIFADVGGASTSETATSAQDAIHVRDCSFTQLWSEVPQAEAGKLKDYAKNCKANATG